MYRTRLAPPIQTVALDFFAPFHFLHESCFPNPQTLFRVSYFLFPLLLLIAYTFISSAKKIDKNNNRRKQRKKKEKQRGLKFFTSHVLSLPVRLFQLIFIKLRTEIYFYRKYFSRDAIFDYEKENARSWNIFRIYM